MPAAQERIISLLPIQYNSQRDNFEWGGLLKAWAQCFYTSCVMFLSNWIPAANTKEYETQYVDDTEVLVGKPGIAEKVMRRYNWITGRTGAWLYTHRDAIQERFAAAALNLKVIGKAGENLGGKLNLGTPADISNALKNGSPVVISTKLTSFGHIVLIIGETDTSWILHDPYGNALTDYRDLNGDSVRYEKNWFNERWGRMVTGRVNEGYMIYAVGA